jgi:hypothetical protein
MDAIRRILARPRLAMACIGGALLFAVWIGWAVYVGNENGWAAAVGVLIFWPLVLSIAALAALIGLGATRLIRGGGRTDDLRTIAGAGPAPKLPKGHDSVTTLTFPS